jgi:hypothetical protein
MKRSFWLSTFIVVCIFFGVITITGCRIFDFFSKDSANQKGSASYTPPAVPETLEQERPIVQVRINELAQALTAGNVDKIVELCNEQDGYKEKFEANKENFPQMAESLKSARLTHLAAGYGSHGIRVGQITVDVGSKSFALPIVKIKGKWFFQDL